MDDFTEANALFDFNVSRGEISPVEKLFNEFEAHEAKEDRALDFYKAILEQMPNPLTRFLMQLIISDEEKHRAVIHAMTTTLKGSLTWTRPADGLLGAGSPAAPKGDLRKITDELIGLEKDGIRAYKSLIEDSRDYYGGLFKVLLDGIIRDSEKHLELLEFLKKSLQGT